MTGSALVSAIIDILVSGISGIATGIGGGLSTLATSIFFTGTGNEQTLSVLGTCIVAFAGISLGLALCRLSYRATLNCYKNLERFNTNQNGSYFLKECNTCNA